MEVYDELEKTLKEKEKLEEKNLKLETDVSIYKNLSNLRKDRINKAIEYIEDNSSQSLCLPNKVYDIRNVDKKTLLEILRGDKE